MEERKAHWEKVFSTKQETEVSWYQQKPQTSINFFTENSIAKDAKIIDIGGGDSYLIDNLLELGYINLFLLDISEQAIHRSKLRLGDKARKVNFIVSNISIVVSSTLTKLPLLLFIFVMKESGEYELYLVFTSSNTSLSYRSGIFNLIFERNNHLV